MVLHVTKQGQIRGPPGDLVHGVSRQEYTIKYCKKHISIIILWLSFCGKCNRDFWGA